METKVNTAPANIDAVGIARTLAIVAVIVVHSTSDAVHFTSSPGFGVVFFNIMNVFFKIGTTTFLFLSAFILFYNYKHNIDLGSSLSLFYRKRIKYILVPYILFSIIYYVLVLYAKGNLTLDLDTFKDFLNKLFTGKAYAHLYFVFINVQLYLIFPIFLLIIRANPVYAKHLLWIGLLLQWSFFFLNQYVFQYPYKASIAFSYLSHYTLGIFAGVYWDTFQKLIKGRMKTVVISLWLIAGMVQCMLWLLMRFNNYSFHLRLLDLTWNIHTYLSAIVLLQISIWLYAKASLRIKRLLLNIGACSFGIYLIHPLFLAFLREYMFKDVSSFNGYVVILSFTVSLSLSWLAVNLLRFIPYSWLLIGKVRWNQLSRTNVEA